MSLWGSFCFPINTSLNDILYCKLVIHIRIFSLRPSRKLEVDYQSFRSVQNILGKLYLNHSCPTVSIRFTVIRQHQNSVRDNNLNQGQQEVLDCFMNGMSYRQAAAYLDVAVSTVFRRRLKIQMIYNAL